MRKRNSPLSALLLVALSLPLSAQDSGASAAPRWAWVKGAASTWERETVSTLYDGDSVVATTTQILTIDVRVLQADPKTGKATIVSDVTRARMQVERPGEETVIFDSAAATGKADPYFAPLAELVGKSMDFELDPRGEIVAARGDSNVGRNVAKEARKADEGDPEAAEFLGSKEGAQSMRPLFYPFLFRAPADPAAVKTGDSWTAERVIDQEKSYETHALTFTLKGPETVDGESAVVIALSGRIELRDAKPVNPGQPQEAVPPAGTITGRIVLAPGGGVRSEEWTQDVRPAGPDQPARYAVKTTVRPAPKDENK